VREVRVTQGRHSCSFRGDPVLRITRRDEFDHWLLRQAEAAGVEVRQGVSLRALRQDADHVHVQTDAGALRARVVVAADGSKSVVRRLLGWRDHAHLARLLEVLTPDKPDSPAFRDGVAAFEFGRVGSGIAGYYWDFPSLVGGVPFMNRGVFDGRSQRAPGEPSLESALAASLASRGHDLGALQLQSHPIRTFNPHGPLSAPRVLLTGDAAGVDPLYGEGISFALAYGEVAASAIADAFAGQRFDFLDYRCRVRRHALLGQLPMRVRFARLGARLQDPRLLALMWSLGSRGLSLTRWRDPGYVPALDERAWLLRA
jgi:flavin-dependent dehydrogenase